MDKENLLHWMTVDVLKEQYHTVIEIVGLEAFIELTSVFGGENLYIPKKDSIFREARNQLIRSEYPHLTFHQLAKKYNLSPIHVRRICATTKVNA